MTAFISYIDDHLSAATMEGSLMDMLLAFQSTGVEGEHTNMPNSGGFFGGNMFNGTEYAYTSKAVPNYAFVAEGNIHYFFPPFSGHAGDGPTAHTVWGELDSITLGAGVDKAGHMVDPLITFTFDGPIFGDVAEGRGNDVHDIIWGLMNGHVDGIDDTKAGVDTHGGLLAALGNDFVTHSVADLVAHNFATETDLALAA
ncbi:MULTISPECIES: heme acquisition protein HasA [Achromobacter]|uniref:Heme acquisition protein HasAp n=1 Tax=Achromobacter ruhlandii TaxID=72557 RepID=A0ABM8LPC3_9BURK|nr:MULTISPECIES: heme acquisition protein HasA [Achromobacter]AKP92178.1 extracellular heme-binding protein [Achromobacter xylosoxidans]AOU95442.1 heme-binding protein A [Achromobacter ruhlandii]MCV6795623.1 heme acquisition protein HasA [Achromobacter ruhlandii]MCV6802863.1 heme acquisition protein HasA [Achromobacter ruhlandii]MCV6807263.1 heme acquisition protein HasA [Achromobacter ruhlandii]